MFANSWGVASVDRNVLKVVLGLGLAIGLPVGSALGYGLWLEARNKALQDRYDATHALNYTIPAGASKNITPIIDEALDFPDVITLTIGLSDTLRITNADRVPARAGPYKIDSGVTYRQRYKEPGRFEIECTEDAADSLTVVVLPPNP